MDSAELDIIAPQLVESVKTSMRANGNAAVETTNVLRKLFPNGPVAGREQDYLSMSKIIETLFALANAPSDKAVDLWKSLTAYSLSGLRTTTI